VELTVLRILQTGKWFDRLAPTDRHIEQLTTADPKLLSTSAEDFFSPLLFNMILFPSVFCQH